MAKIPEGVAKRLNAAKHVVMITGAGVSSQLGPIAAKDFARYWTPAGFARDVEGAWNFLLARRKSALAAQPNAAHLGIHTLALWTLRKRASSFMLVTQNHDRLHHRVADSWEERGEPRAGQYAIVELHGQLFQGRCPACGEIFELPASLDPGDPHTLPKDQKPRYFICANCKAMARPTVQWAGEAYAPGGLDRVGATVRAADAVIFAGASGRVPVVRWLLHEAHWAAHAFTLVLDEHPENWTERDGTPTWPPAPIISATIAGDIEDVIVSLVDALEKRR